MNNPLPALEINGLRHFYGKVSVLNIEHLAIPGRAITGLVGPNGSGKSTLLRLLGCIERPSEGSIAFDGQAIKPFCEAARFRIALLPQEPFLMKRSVFNNVSYGLKLRGEKEAMGDRVRQALFLVGLPADRFAHRPWYALSGGEAQRVALAARLILRPKVLLLDEPTANVDAASAQLIRKASLQASREWGTTLVIASHDRQWLHEVSDTVLHLFKGRIFGTGRETVVFGPWERMGNGSWARQLAKGQHLIVSAPPGPDSAAVIRFTDAGGDGDAKGDRRSVRGIISRLNLECSSGIVMATIMAGDLSFTVHLPERPGRDRAIFPGQTFEASYGIEEIRWV
jgi:tungstate transport system ATP-binding protein